MPETSDLSGLSERYLDLWQSQIEANSAAFWAAAATAAGWVAAIGDRENGAMHNEEPGTEATAGPETAAGPSRTR